MDGRPADTSNFAESSAVQEPSWLSRTLIYAHMTVAIAQGLATSPSFRQDIQRYDDLWGRSTDAAGWNTSTP